MQQKYDPKLKVQEFKFTDNELKVLIPMALRMAELRNQIKNIDSQMVVFVLKVVCKRLGMTRGKYSFDFNLQENKLVAVRQSDILIADQSPPKTFQQFPRRTF